MVFIDNPNLRPIVRGKEGKPVGFIAKVHKLQIDVISFLQMRTDRYLRTKGIQTYFKTKGRPGSHREQRVN